MHSLERAVCTWKWERGSRPMIEGGVRLFISILFSGTFVETCHVYMEVWAREGVYTHDRSERADLINNWWCEGLVATSWLREGCLEISPKRELEHTTCLKNRGCGLPCLARRLQPAEHLWIVVASLFWKVKSKMTLPSQTSGCGLISISEGGRCAELLLKRPSRGRPRNGCTFSPDDHRNPLNSSMWSSLAGSIS